MGRITVLVGGGGGWEGGTGRSIKKCDTLSQCLHNTVINDTNEVLFLPNDF